MTDYTPTTDHVRAQYARQENYDYYYEGDLFLTPDGQVSAAEFDRWLAEVQAEAWDQGFDAGKRDVIKNESDRIQNPYRIKKTK